MYIKALILCPGLSGHPMSSSLWCASWPQRAWQGAAALAGWCVCLKRSNAASPEASPLPNSRRPWKSTRSWTCGRSTKPAAASHLSEWPLKPGLLYCWFPTDCIWALFFFLSYFSVAQVTQNGGIFRCCWLRLLKILFLCYFSLKVACTYVC